MQRHALSTGKHRATDLPTPFPHRFVTLHHHGSCMAGSALPALPHRGPQWTFCPPLHTDSLLPGAPAPTQGLPRKGKGEEGSSALLLLQGSEPVELDEAVDQEVRGQGCEELGVGNHAEMRGTLGMGAEAAGWLPSGNKAGVIGTYCVRACGAVGHHQENRSHD